MALVTVFILLIAVITVASATTWKINCGGNAISDYRADNREYFSQSGSQVRFFGRGARVYDSHSWASSRQDLVYSLAVKPGQHTVKLLFSENYSGAARPGARVLNVDINGVRVATRMDVWVLSGRKLFAPYDIVKSGLQPVNGKFTIRVSSVKENAYISGIEISRDQSVPVTVKPETSAPMQGSWRTVKTSGLPTRRHEACSVMVAGKMYLIGGRGKKPVDVYDPATKRWSSKRVPNDEMHHMQCVSYQNRYVYVAGSWYGGFPNEKAHTSTFVYDTVNDSWRTEPGLGSRSRGGGATAFYKGKLYLAMGNRGGHGAQATTLGEFDSYDPSTKRWTALPTAPDARDHVGGGIIGNYFCVAGGRDGGVANFWKRPITKVNCYNFNTGAWERKADMPVGRAGAATGTTCNGLLMIAGGEGIPPGQKGKAFDRVDLYDVKTNKFLPPSFLKKGRHGTGLAISSCSCGNIYYPSGSGGLGGGPELTSTEVWRASGPAKDNC